MRFETAATAIERHLNDTSFDEVEIGFHGGEPFLQFKLIQELCEWTWSREWKLPYIFFATTNGTPVKAKIQKWLTKHSKEFYCCVSLDGTPEMHNKNRSGSFNQIDLEFFKQTWPTQPAKMTVSEQTLPSLADGVIYLHSKNIEFTCNIAFFSNWKDPQGTTGIFAQELSKLLDWYLEHPKQKPCNLFMLPLEKLGHLLMYPDSQPKNPSRWCGFGHSIVAVSPEGREYPCHVLIPFGDTRNQPETAYFLEDTSWPDVSDALTDPRCVNCILSPICPTCYAANRKTRGAFEFRDPNACALFKLQSRASACLYGEMLASSNKYAVLADCNLHRQRLIVEAILAIDGLSE